MLCKLAKPLITLLLATTLTLSFGCSTPSTPQKFKTADLGHLRTQLYEHPKSKPDTRNYILERSKLGIITLADGYPDSAGPIFEEVYDFLRTQGINKDRTVAAIAINDGVRVWKGEPFEQAIAILYYGLQQATLGSWDNARAAANNSLFYLRDFGSDEEGKRLDTATIAARAAVYEKAQAEGKDADKALEEYDYLDHGYNVQKSNFTLGYLLAGIANQQLDRPEEASDNFRAAATYSPFVKPLIDRLTNTPYNTILFVSYGLGPKKTAYGLSNSLSKFIPRTHSDDAPIFLQLDNNDAGTFPLAYDINAMAADHMWNNLENIRKAKAIAADILFKGGLIATCQGIKQDSKETQIAGLAAIGTSVLLSVSAHADCRYNDFIPQRFYIVPLYLTNKTSNITIQVQGKPWTRLTLTDLTPPQSSRAQLRYVSLYPTKTPDQRPPQWASPPAHYDNDYTRLTSSPGEPCIPYILGGYDVKTPTNTVINQYPSSVASIIPNLYNIEKIATSREDQNGYTSSHVLEGGSSLVPPIPGSIGYARIFNQPHPSYKPKTNELKELKALLKKQNTPNTN